MPIETKDSQTGKPKTRIQPEFSRRRFSSMLARAGAVVTGAALGIEATDILKGLPVTSAWVKTAKGLLTPPSAEAGSPLHIDHTDPSPNIPIRARQSIVSLESTSDKSAVDALITPYSLPQGQNTLFNVCKVEQVRTFPEWRLRNIELIGIPIGFTDRLADTQVASDPNWQLREQALLASANSFYPTFMPVNITYRLATQSEMAGKDYLLVGNIADYNNSDPSVNAGNLFNNVEKQFSISNYDPKTQTWRVGCCIYTTDAGSYLQNAGGIKDNGHGITLLDGTGLNQNYLINGKIDIDFEKALWHELGHAIGMLHNQTVPDLTSQNVILSIMSPGGMIYGDGRTVILTQNDVKGICYVLTYLPAIADNFTPN